MAKEFPLALFDVARFHLYPAGVRVTGGAALAGPPQTIDWSGGGWWRGKLSEVEMWTPDHHRVWRALMMYAVNDGGEVVMPIIDDPQRPMSDPSAGLAMTGYSDGTGFSDGGRFRSGLIGFELAEAALEGDTTLKLKRLGDTPLLGGEYWSFHHPAAGHRLYASSELDDENAHGVREVLFGVPLRTDLAAGAFADFETPRLTMKIISEPSEAFPEMKPPFDSVGGFAFIESFDYLDD